MNRRRWFTYLAVSGFALILGRGRAHADRPCPRCGGAGRIAYYDDIHKRDIVTNCGSCNGRGTISGGGGGGCA